MVQIFSTLCVGLLVFAAAQGVLLKQKRHAGLIVVEFDESICHPEPTADLPQYIVGYDLTIDEASKASFYPEAGESIPVRVSGFGRHWNFQKPTIGFGATHLGAAIDALATFNGVVFTVPSGDNVNETLRGHDDRQKSFCRQKVPKDNIKRLGKDNETALEDGDYWTYVTRAEVSSLPNPTYPIVQSYVDIFISGCMDIGTKHEIETFADECVESTLGWESTWVNDRVFPRRPTVKQPRAPEIDKLLATKTPIGFSRIVIEG